MQEKNSYYIIVGQGILVGKKEINFSFKEIKIVASTNVLEKHRFRVKTTKNYSQSRDEVFFGSDSEESENIGLKVVEMFI